MAGRRVARLGALAACFVFSLPVLHASAASSKTADPGAGVGTVPQGTQSDAAFTASYAAAGVTNVDATSGQVSCYRPEVPYFAALGSDGYDGMTPCASATTGEDTGQAGPYATQLGSNPGYPADGPMLVKDHSESDIRVDPTNPRHLIGTSKWVVSAEGYNHLLGFYESFDGGATWPVQGHVPGYEGWTDNTDPIGAFDPWGNFYLLNLPYEFAYTASGGHDFRTNKHIEPNPVVAAEAISVDVRPHGAASATDWTVNHAGHLDIVAGYDQLGNEPDKQWLTIDTNPGSPHYGRVYAMWVDFHDGFTAAPFVSYADANRDGTHSDWSKPAALPQGFNHPQGDTYLLPHVTPDGTVYTTITNSEPNGGFCCLNIGLDASSDGGLTWSFVSRLASDVAASAQHYQNTEFRDGIADTFTVGNTRVNGHYPLYVSWEDYSTGLINTILSASYDGGHTWSAPIQVNDNASPADEFQPSLATAGDGTVSVAFYDRRLACPDQGTSEAAAAGIALDTDNAFYAALPPYGAANYCINTAIQFYTPTLAPIGNNIRLSGHTWDPELNSPHPYGIGRPIGFIGDYFGNVADGGVEVTTSVSTFNDGTNPAFRQQQIVAEVPIP